MAGLCQMMLGVLLMLQDTFLGAEDTQSVLEGLVRVLTWEAYLGVLYWMVQRALQVSWVVPL